MYEPMTRDADPLSRTFAAVFALALILTPAAVFAGDEATDFTLDEVSQDAAQATDADSDAAAEPEADEQSADDAEVPEPSN